ncbi:MAG: murein L,D-transpeptidase catalytic domain family protein [Bacteroidales bacterium]|nr:murein L,D-transpeptidase catalytic domain family protein [Bacteroidales bacterium]
MKIKTLLIVLLTIIHSLAIFNSANSSVFDPNTGVLPGAISKTELFENYLHSMFQEIGLEGVMKEDVFEKAIVGYYNLMRSNLLGNDSMITIIDYERPSNEKRLYVINLHTRSLAFHSLVAHGTNSGNIYATHFSNKSGSKQSSIGFFITGNPYSGKHDYSLKLIGLDTLYNSNAMPRGVVFHGANYVSEEYIVRNGRLGRSFGCPALPDFINKEVINVIKGGSCVYIYYPDEEYMSYTSYLDKTIAANYYYGDRDFSVYEKAQPISPRINASAHLR